MEAALGERQYNPHSDLYDPAIEKLDSSYIFGDHVDPYQIAKQMVKIHDEETEAEHASHGTYPSNVLWILMCSMIGILILAILGAVCVKCIKKNDEIDVPIVKTQKTDVDDEVEPLD